MTPTPYIVSLLLCLATAGRTDALGTNRMIQSQHPVVGDARQRTINQPRSKPLTLLAATPGGGGGGGRLAGMWSAYVSALDTHPMRTKMATAAVLASAGDMIAQRLEGLAVLSVGRVLTLVAVNVCYITPILTAFYSLNEWLCGKVLGLPSGTTKGTAARLAFDQLANAPIVIFGFFMAFGLANNLIATPLSGGAIAPLSTVLASTGKGRSSDGAGGGAPAEGRT